MPKTPSDLNEEALRFLAEYHLASLTTMRRDGTPHVCAVGFTWDDDSHTARIITSGHSQKAINAMTGGYAAVTQLDGPRWLTLEGRCAVDQSADGIADGVHRYAQRYRQPRDNPDRVVITIDVTRVMGSASLFT